jgi:endonuclease/exonuclease/phosphatase family metal-dependent hydrolase
LGSSSFDEGRAIAVDEKGNVYIVGTSDATWGNPVHYYAGEKDAFAAKLNSKGVLLWHTFMGHYRGDELGLAITVDVNRNVYVGGWGGWFWDTMPVYPISSGEDGWIAKLKPGGVRDWYTIMGSTGIDSIQSIAVAPDGNIFVAGSSEGPWFTRPIYPYAGESDAFVAKLDSDGRRLWHTFMGSSAPDDGRAIALDRNGNVYISGTSWMPWGKPINPFAGNLEAFVVKLNSSGARKWHTFMGSVNEADSAWSMTLDRIGNVYLAGVSTDTWGTPLIPHAGHFGAFAAKLDYKGILLWNTFMEMVTGDGNAITMDTSGNIYLGGSGHVLWGTPVNPPTGGWDAFAAKIDRGIRIVTWNILNYSGLNDDSRDESIRIILEQLEPDVLVVQEMASEYGVEHFLKNILNLNPRKKYKAAQFFDGPDTDNALFYDKSRLNLKSHKQIPTSFRDISEYSLRIRKGSSKGTDFKIYSVHFTEGRGTSYKKQRENQANTLRNYLNGLPQDTLFLVCGTFNITSSKEKAYKILTESQSENVGGNIGRLKDLIDKSGKWYNRVKFKHTHTESTRKTKIGGGAGGGLDDRYDMILVSNRMGQSGGLTFMPGSYVVGGNDGKHLNKAINEPANKIFNSEIADALYKAADHLPVIIDLVSLEK